MKKWAVAGAAISGIVLSVGVVAWAVERSDWGHRGWRGDQFGMSERMLRMLDHQRFRAELGLNDEQVGRLRQIVLDAQKSSIKTRADMQLRGIELREMLRSENPDRAAVMKKVQELSDLRGQRMKQHVEALLMAKTVLTPEQQKKIESFMRIRPGRGPGGERFGMRPDRGGMPPGPGGTQPATPHGAVEPPVQ